MKSVFENFENVSTWCDVIIIIIPNFREMDQIRKQRNYFPDRHQNWYLEYFEGEKSKNEITFRKILKFHHLLWRHYLHLQF